MICFDEYQQQIHNFCIASVEKFKKEKADVTISTIGLYCDPFSGRIFINFDTPNNSENLVREHQENNSDWYGEDEYGSYNDHCPDFEYYAYEKLEISEWREQFEISEVITIKYHFKKTQIDLAQVNDEVLNKQFFIFLKDILRNVVRDEVFTKLNKSETFRVGIQMANSEYFFEYWVLK